MKSQPSKKSGKKRKEKNEEKNKQTINKNIQTEIEDTNEELLASAFQFSLFLAISTSSFSTLLGF